MVRYNGMWSSRRRLRIGVSLAMAAAPGFSTRAADAPTFGGFFQLDYRRAGTGDLSSAAPHDLNLRRARLSAKGKATERLSYNVEVQGDGGAPGSASFLDVHLDFAISPRLLLRAGQYKYDFDVEGFESDSGNPFIDRSYATNAVAGSLDAASTPSSAAAAFRDRGVSLIGTTTSAGFDWHTAAGFFQGSGRNPDNNGAFSVTLQAGASRGGLRANFGWAWSPTQDTDAPRHLYRALTAGLGFDRGPWFARGEYYVGRRDALARVTRVHGYYLVGGWTLLRDLDLFVRYQWVRDRDFSARDDTASSVDIGLRHYFQRMDRRSGLWLSVNALLRQADSGFARGLSLLNDGRGVLLTSGEPFGAVFVARLQVRF